MAIKTPPDQSVLDVISKRFVQTYENLLNYLEWDSPTEVFFCGPFPNGIIGYNLQSDILIRESLWPKNKQRNDLREIIEPSFE